jgi:SPP1 family predicted phage head-tail adaptor
MDVASLKKPIRLEKWATSKNAQGDNKESKTTYNLWAEVGDSSGSRSVKDRQYLSKARVFKIGFRPELKVDSNWTIVYDGVRYKISSIEKVGQKRFMWEIIASGKS